VNKQKVLEGKMENNSQNKTTLKNQSIQQTKEQNREIPLKRRVREYMQSKGGHNSLALITVIKITAN
jgi:hypothetical protein